MESIFHSVISCWIFDEFVDCVFSIEFIAETEWILKLMPGVTEYFMFRHCYQPKSNTQSQSTQLSHAHTQTHPNPYWNKSFVVSICWSPAATGLFRWQTYIYRSVCRPVGRSAVYRVTARPTNAKRSFKYYWSCDAEMARPIFVVDFIVCVVKGYPKNEFLIRFGVRFSGDSHILWPCVRCALYIYEFILWNVNEKCSTHNAHQE